MKIKFWSDYNSDLNEKSTLIIWGDEYEISNFIDAEIFPDFYVLRGKIFKYKFNHQDEKLKNLIFLKGKIKIISVLGYTKESKYVSLLKSYLDLSNTDITLYTPNNGSNMLGPPFFQFGTKQIVVGAKVYLNYLLDQLKDKEGAKNCFFNPIPMKERFLYSQNLKLFYKNKKILYQDLDNTNVSFKDGIRTTLYQPTNYDNTFYFFGDSQLENIFSEDKYTLCSQLQNVFNLNNLNYRVQNNAVGGLFLSGILNQIKALDFSQGDFIILFKTPPRVVDQHSIRVFCKSLKELNNFCQSINCKFIYLFAPTIYEKVYHGDWEKVLLKNIMNDVFSPKTIARVRKFISLYCIKNNIVFYDPSQSVHYSDQDIFYDLSHWGEFGNELLAKEIYNFFFEYLHFNHYDFGSTITKDSYQQGMEAMLLTLIPSCQNYLKNIKTSFNICGKNNGGLVLFCKDYSQKKYSLIEAASKEVDVLFVFVVKGNQSLSFFDDKIMAIRDSISNLKNVVVVSGDEFILSPQTLPDLYITDKSSKEIDASLDLTVFASEIAPALDIKTRFIYDHPASKYQFETEYHLQMKKIFPTYDIQIKELKNAENI